MVYPTDTFSSFMWDEPKPKYTYTFIALCILFYVLSQFTAIERYMLYIPSYTLYYPWTTITALFMHVDLEHLFYNMLALLIFGSILERRIGNQEFAALYLLSGIIGNIGYYLTAVNPHIPVVGASGAIYGIVGTLAVLEPFRLVYIYGLMPIPMIGAALLWTLGDIAGLFSPGTVAHGAHLAGIFIGVIAGFIYRRRPRALLI